MLDNPWSIAIFIIAGLLIGCAIFSKRLREMHNKEVKDIKNRFENLSPEEKKDQKKTESLVILTVEISIVAIIIISSILIGSSG